MTDTVIEEITEEKITTGNQKYTHVVRPPENNMIFGVLVQQGNPDPSAKDIVGWARKNRVQVVALCGYQFVPERPRRLPDLYGRSGHAHAE